MNEIEEKLMEDMWEIIEMFEDYKIRLKFRKQWINTYKKVTKHAKYR